VITLKQFSDSTSKNFRILVDDDWAPTTVELPPLILPPGLPNEQQWYLYNEILEFCQQGMEDRMCPLPSTAQQQCTNAIEDENDVTDPPAPKRPRKCGI